LEHADDVVGNTINTMPPAAQQQIGEELVARAEVAQHRDQRVPAGAAVVVLTSPAVRSAVRKLIESLAPHLAVLSLAEVVGDVRLNQVGVVGADNGGDGEPGKSLTGSGEDGFIEDGYEPANV
jgi:flagellar biosynthesis component FlhA